MKKGKVCWEGKRLGEKKIITTRLCSKAKKKKSIKKPHTEIDANICKDLSLQTPEDTINRPRAVGVEHLERDNVYAVRGGNAKGLAGYRRGQVRAVAVLVRVVAGGRDEVGSHVYAGGRCEF